MSWTLAVEDFGRIERADVDVRPPLLMFFGENSTGKSYLTSLLWGIVALQMEVDWRASPKLASSFVDSRAFRSSSSKSPRPISTPRFSAPSRG